MCVFYHYYYFTFYFFKFLNPYKKEGRKKLEIETAGKTSAPGGRPTHSHHVTKPN